MQQSDNQLATEIVRHDISTCE